MTVPHYIGENESDMRGIQCGWYGIEDDGDLSSGPFSNREKCVRRITQPTNENRASELQRLPNYTDDTLRWRRRREVQPNPSKDEHHE